VLDFGGSQGLRLLSNLLLTRLLFPEAFGLMALVSVIMVGLALFSDTGIQPLIVQNEKGDDPDFLNTAWTVQAIRGVVLWLVVLAVAGSVAALYDEPLLAELLPIAGLAMIIEGLKPTSVFSVNRHLALGCYVRIKLAAQATGLLILALLAWQLQSVWALVIGNLFTVFITTAAYHIFLPGQKIRIRLMPSAVKEMFRFGKWIFLSSAAVFLINQGDRAVLGMYISLEQLGIYSIAYFLGSLPVMLNSALQTMVMRPLHRLRPPSVGEENRKVLFRARRSIAGAILAVTAFFAFAGPSLVNILYDSRYAEAGAMITLFSLAAVPQATLNTITPALIGHGNSRAIFLITGSTAFLQIALLVLGIEKFGVIGAIFAPFLAILINYPIRLFYSLKYRVFDPVQDFGLTIFGFLITILACALHWRDVYTILPS
jgi:O-antigen/teichoic acid export membrane protein